jgi:preprotein translocase subunit SecG
MAGFDISGVEPSGSATAVLVSNKETWKARLTYTIYFPNVLFAILHLLLVLIILYSKQKSIAAELTNSTVAAKL